MYISHLKVQDGGKWLLIYGKDVNFQNNNVIL